MQLNKLLIYSASFCFLFCFGVNSSSIAQETSQVCSSESEEAIPGKLHIFSPSGEPIPINIRTATVDEIVFLLRSNESDEPERIENYWEKSPTAYYRWDLNSGNGDSGIISDIFKEVGILAASGEKFSDDALPRLITTRINSEERIIAFGASYLGDVKFHSDFQLRKQGYKGIGTVIVADYLSWCLKNGLDGRFTSVSNSYGFYEKLGFKYISIRTPDKFKDPSVEQFGMELPLNEIPKALRNLYVQDTLKSKNCGTVF